MSKRTAEIVHRLIPKGWMFDYAPGEKGKFFRVVVNISTLPGTVEGLVKAIEEMGQEVVVVTRTRNYVQEEAHLVLTRICST
jgi:hypothetical protein